MNDQTRYIKDRAIVMSIIKFILITGLIIIGLYFFAEIFGILVPFLIGYILAWVSYNISNKIFKNSSRKIKNGFAYLFLAIILVLLGGIISALTVSLLAQINKAINSVSNLVMSLDVSTLESSFYDILQNIKDTVPEAVYNQSLEHAQSLLSKIATYVPIFLSNIASGIWGLISNLPYLIFVVVCVLLSSVYFIKDGFKVFRGSMRLIPNKKFRKKTVGVINSIFTTLYGTVGGYLLLMIITSVESYIFFLIADVKYAVILAIVAGVVDFLPVLGISATMIPIIVLKALSSDWKAAIVLIIGLTIISFVRRIIEPKILSVSMHVHPLLMLMAMLVGVFVWDEVGFLYGPLVMIIATDVIKTFNIDKMVKKSLSRVLKKFMDSSDGKDDDDDDDDDNEDCSKPSKETTASKVAATAAE